MMASIRISIFIFDNPRKARSRIRPYIQNKALISALNNALEERQIITADDIVPSVVITKSTIQSWNGQSIKCWFIWIILF